jgi:cytochrome oxidase assembly protein ShyY1
MNTMASRAASTAESARTALRLAVWTVRQPRYAALTGAMTILAIVCVIAGTWQLQRYQRSVRINDAIQSNAQAAAAELSAVTVNLTGQGAVPSHEALDYRTVDAVGSFLPRPAEFVRYESVDNVNGFWVLGSLRTPDGILLVVRGFVAAASTGAPPATVSPAPVGSVRIVGQLRAADTSAEHLSSDGGQVSLESINATQQSARLGAPVYQAYLTLNPGEPGTAGLTPLGAPDLSNPAGGAPPWQHLAYIIQWYLFALIALGAPFAICRRELREAGRRYLGVDTGTQELGADAASDPLSLTSGDGTGVSATGVLATRPVGSLVRTERIVEARTSRAERLADRYGRSLGPAGARAPDLARAVARDVEARAAAISTPARSDPYHDSYNDQLWLLALADGNIPEFDPTLIPEVSTASTPPTSSPLVIDADPQLPHDDTDPPPPVGRD